MSLDLLGERNRRIPAQESAGRRILIVSDAWHPQVNGVVRTLETVGGQLREMGHTVHYLTPQNFWTVPLPSYPEIRLSLVSTWTISRVIEEFAPDHLHIATEGPLGLLARRHALERGLHFTTSFHTRFPEYVAMRAPIPADWCYGYLRWFHGPASRTLVPSTSLMAELAGRGFTHLGLWSRGVDLETFKPGPKTEFTDLAGPHLLYVGRVAAEKNVEAFLAAPAPGTKIVVGDGPDRARLEQAYPEAVFLGYRRGEELSALYRSADVLVFPSRTDTFGNVMTEALASGTPVAAYPVTGPIDVLTDPLAGAVDEDLGAAIARALTLKRADARRHAERFSWAASARQLLVALVPHHAAELAAVG